jgi:predicted permease
MGWFDELRRRASSYFHRDEIDRDLKAEMDFHMEMKARKYRSEGMSDREARARARQQFGNTTQLHEQGREAWGWTAVEQFLQDVRVALRSMRKSASFTTASVFTLALGIGATVAVFGILNAVLLRPFPYKDAGHLMIAPVSVPDFRDLRASTNTLDDLAIWASNLYAVRFGDETEQILGAIVSDRFFPMLSAAERGRTFGMQDVYQPVAVISHRLWKTRFGGDSSALGKTITLNNETFTIVGIMPADFQFPSGAFQLWVPFDYAMQATPGQRENRGLRIFRTVVRVKPGATREQVQGEAAAISARLAKDYPDTNAESRIRFTPLREWILGDVRTGLAMLMATAAFVLAIACGNVANLMLARAVARTREFGLRASLGAGRMRLMRQNLTESFVLALSGSALGVALAYGLVHLATRLPGADLPRISTVSIDAPVLAFALAACCGATMLFGLAPAWRASRTNLLTALHDGGRGTSRGAASNRLQRTFIAAEIVLACVVLVGAGLLAKSFSRLLHVDSGFEADNLLTMNIGLVSYKDPVQRTAVISQVLENLSHVASVQYAGGSTGLPPVTPQRATRFAAEGVTLGRGADTAYLIAASTKFFHALGTRLLEGREFTSADTATAPKVVIVSEGVARRLYPNQNALGRHVRLLNPDYPNDWRTIVGVVRTVRYAGLNEADQPAIYTPFAQTPMFWMYVMVRHTGDNPALVQNVRSAIRDASPTLSPVAIQPMDTVLWGTVAQPRFRTELVCAFAAVALVIAAIGIYGLIAYASTQRTQEIGVRLALGATRMKVMWLVLAQAMRVCGIGLTIGIPAALLAARTLSALLFGVSPTDAEVVLAAAAVLIAVAGLAAYIPARRASKLDPSAALRHE